jgi:alcohol dehydrogenase class IV
MPISDPGVLAAVPAELTAHTGLDALSHAIESCVSEGCDFLSRAHAVAADAAIARVEALTRALDIPAGLRVLGVEEADFGRFAVKALRDAYITTNPRPVTESDVRDICVAAY